MQPLTLPDDLTERGWKLSARAPDRMFAVSVSWGCTETKTNIRAVIAEARSMSLFVEWAKKQQDSYEQPSPHPSTELYANP